MSTAQQVLDSLNKIDIKSACVEVAKDFEAIFTLDIIDQLKHGKNSLGEQIGKYRDRKYAQWKYDKNSLAGLGNMDLIYTGEFSKGITINVGSDDLTYDSTGKNKDSGDITEIYSMNGPVLGLNPDTISKENEALTVALVNKIEEKI